MSTEAQLICMTLLAGADLSAAVNRAVKISAANTCVKAAAATDQVVGVLQNDPASAAAATVAYGGITKVVLGASVSAGDRVSSDANGAAITAVATAKSFGLALDGGASGDISRVLLTINGHTLPA